MLTESVLWERVKSLKEKTVYTLIQRRANPIAAVTDTEVKIRNRKTGTTRGGIYRNYETLYIEGRLGDGKEGNLRGMRVILAILSEALRDEIHVIKGEIRLKSFGNQLG